MQKAHDDFIWDNIAETALSLQEREALKARPQSMLRAAARNLRLTESDDDIGRGSELAEVILYGVMRHKYNALPVVPKIFYKQNTQDNAKGADSVHIRVEGADDFSLWFGETKFYVSIEDVRLGRVIESVEAALDSAKLRKENSIITNIADLDGLALSPALRAKIKDALSNLQSIDSLKPKIRVPILLIHECPITAAATQMTADYVERISSFHKARAQSYFDKQIDRLAQKVFRYSDIEFHLILFPVPFKKPIVDGFLAAVTHYRR